MTHRYFFVFCGFVITVFTGCGSIQDETLTTVRTEAPTAENCGKCHGDIFKEWSDSAHAHAWTRPTFVKTTFNHQVEACLPCHAPRTIFTANEPLQLRGAHRNEGVTCIACHLLEGEHHGPFIAGAITPHATSQNANFYASAALCGTCHTGTMKQWSSTADSAPETRTCQECHMPAIRRKMTQGNDLISDMIVATHEEHDLKRHTFGLEVMANFPDAVRLSATPAPATLKSPETPATSVISGLGGISVTLENRLPHSIPTGDFGYRHARLTAECLDNAGQMIGRGEWDFFRDLGTELSPGGVFQKTFEVDPSQELGAELTVKLRLEKLDQKGARILLISEASLPITVSKK